MSSTKMPEQNSIRRRKKTNKKKKGTEKKEEDVVKSPKKASRKDNEDETLLQAFLGHPLIRFGPLVLFAYLMYHGQYYIRLRHPEILAQGTLGLINLRPAVTPQDERQVLILGAEMADTQYVATGMADALNLEITSEAFDAQNYFCRDGTASWFNIMRFLQPLNVAARIDGEFSDADKLAQVDTFKEMCVDRSNTFVQVFHPKFYAPSQNCSVGGKWSNCWAKECVEQITSMWGCAWKDEEPCPLQFSRVLHQVRHPIRTIEMLNATLCEDEQLKSPFMKLVKGWFTGRDWDNLSCLETMAWYEIDFHNTLIRAREAGLVDGVFQVETTSPCEVAAQAGFLNEYSAVYGPNVPKTSKKCDGSKPEAKQQSKDTFAKVKEENAPNVAAFERLSYKDFEGGRHGSQREDGDMTLVEDLKKLVSDLGYDGDTDVEFL